MDWPFRSNTIRLAFSVWVLGDHALIAFFLATTSFRTTMSHSSNPSSRYSFPISIALSTLTGLAIVGFLLGRFVPVPSGTHQGGLVGAAGVGLILLTVFALMWIVFHKRSGKSAR